MPEHHPHTMHFDPYHFNDSLPGLAAGKRKGYVYADQDANCTRDGEIVIKHWGLPRKDGFKWVVKAGRVRRDLHPLRPINRRTWAGVKRLRRRPDGKGTRYRRAIAHARWCHNHGMIMCLEAKGSPGFNNVETWQRLATQCDAAGVPRPYVMTLQNIRGWRRRLRAAHAAGFECAILPRGRKPSDWPWFEGMGIKVWGSWK